MNVLSWRLAILLWVVLGISPPQTRATVIPTPLRQLSQYAGIAFAGTVDSMRVAVLSENVVTLVHFSHLKFAKGGSKSDTLTLRMGGGRYGALVYSTMEQPSFEIGKRYVLLCKSNLGTVGNVFTPIIGMFQGFYPVHSDKTGAPVVHDWGDRPVVAIKSGHIVSVSRQPAPRNWRRAGSTTEDLPFEVLYSDEDPGTRTSEEAFLASIRSFAEGR